MTASKIEINTDKLQELAITVALILVFTYLALVTLRGTYVWGRAWLVRRLVPSAPSANTVLARRSAVAEYDEYDELDAEEEENYPDDPDAPAYELDDDPPAPSARRVRRVTTLNKRRG
jgi:hypothetical protein